MRKIFAIFVAITLWNASALGALQEFDPSDKLVPVDFCNGWTLDECNEEAQRQSTTTETYKCCQCTIPAAMERVYSCNPEYIDLGYRLSGSVCVKDAITEEDEKGWTKTTYGNCTATVTYIEGLSKTGYMLYKSGSNGFQTMMPTACMATIK